jgi:uncharacterized protein YndB with AHSA1/START domain
MPSVTDTTYIDRPPQIVFAALEDPETQVRYDHDTLRSVEKLTPGPIGMGTRFRGDFKGMGKVEYEYAKFELGHLIEHAVKMPFGEARHRFLFEQSTDGTRLAQTITVAPNLLGQLLWPLMIKRMMENRVRSLNERVKVYVESVAP